MKKFIFLILPILLVASSVLAQTNRIPPPNNVTPDIPSFFLCDPNESLFQCFMSILTLLLRIIIAIAIFFAAIMISWAGVSYITKGEAKDERGKIQEKIIYAAIGLVVALLAWGLTYLIQNIVMRGRID
jgi:cell division protein FtsL